MNKPVALTLAAGQSMRMGTCKASLAWCNGHTLLTYQVSEFQQAGFRSIVVVGLHNRNRLQAELEANLGSASLAVLVVLNPETSRGKTSSIRLGLQEISPDCPAIAISSVDQPRPAAVYQQLWQAHQSMSSPITAPIYEGRLGHPLLFSSQLLPQLQAIQEESLGLRQVVQQFRSSIQAMEWDSGIVFQDLNTPEAYQEAYRAAGLNL